MSEELFIRLTAAQKEALKMALANTGGTATFARELLLQTATDLLAIEAGKMTVEDAAKNYQTLIANAVRVKQVYVNLETRDDEKR